MIWLITISVFVYTASVLFALAYLLMRRQKVAFERLAEIKGEAPRISPIYSEARAKLAPENLMVRLVNLIPEPFKDLSQARRMLIQAGYRSDDAPIIFYALKALCATFVLALAILSGMVKTDDPLKLISTPVIAAAIGYILPNRFLSYKLKQRQQQIRLSLPDALDLLIICVEAGLGLNQALVKVSEELKISHPELSEEFYLTNLEIRAGKPRADALRNLAERTGVEEIASLSATLIQTDRFGTSVAQSLRVYSDTMRVKRRQRAEEEAAKLPVKLVFPIFFFIFPAVFIVILAPALIRFYREIMPQFLQMPQAPRPSISLPFIGAMLNFSSNFPDKEDEG